MGTIDYIFQCERDNEELTKDIKYWKNRSGKLSKENKDLKQALIDIREIVQHSKAMDFQKEQGILQIIDKVLGSD